jgi:hypothetical protein
LITYIISTFGELSSFSSLQVLLLVADGCASSVV